VSQLTACHGTDLTFRWSYRSRSQYVFVGWFFAASQDPNSLFPIGFSYTFSELHLEPNYINRVEWANDSKCGIVLKNVTVGDTGNYYVRIQFAGSPRSVSVTRVMILSGTGRSSK